MTVIFVEHQECPSTALTQRPLVPDTPVTLHAGIRLGLSGQVLQRSRCT